MPVRDGFSRQDNPLLQSDRGLGGFDAAAGSHILSQLWVSSHHSQVGSGSDPQVTDVEPAADGSWSLRGQGMHNDFLVKLTCDDAIFVNCCGNFASLAAYDSQVCNQAFLISKKIEYGSKN